MQLIALVAILLLALLAFGGRKLTEPLFQRSARDKGRRKPTETREYGYEFAEELAPRVARPSEPTESYPLPAGYGDNRVVLMARDPHWLFTYWETPPIEGFLDWPPGEGRPEESARVLRVHDVTDQSSYDVEIGTDIGSWYLNVGKPKHSYYVEIGRRTKSGRFVLLARSNVVSTPADSVSEIIAEEWPPLDWGAHFGRRVTYIGVSSPEIGISSAALGAGSPGSRGPSQGEPR